MLGEPWVLWLMARAVHRARREGARVSALNPRRSPP